MDMRTVREWLGEYGASHENPTNELLHWICVPLIVLTVFGLLWSLPVPMLFAAISPWVNWATVAALSPSLTVGIFIAFTVLLLVTHWLATLSWPLWLTSITIFVVAWIGQFIGHAIEGKRPSFLEDLQFLLIGPLWLLAAAYRKIGLRY